MASTKATDITAIIISICALSLAVVQGRQNEKSNKIAVRPNVDVTFNAVRGSDEAHGFKIRNSGVGPAIIKSIIYYVDGIKIEENTFNIWPVIFDKVNYQVTDNFEEFHIVHLPIGYYIKSDQEEYLLKLLPSKNNEEKNIIKREFTPNEWGKLNRLGIKIEYSSMQGENCSIHYTPANVNPYVRENCA
jgi:hypothetical protein